MRSYVDDHYVWSIYSPANRAAAEKLWRELSETDVAEMAVTVANEERQTADLRSELEIMIDGAIEHFPRVRRIRIVGPGALSEAIIEKVMTDRGFTRDPSGLDDLIYKSESLE